jgi:hypothetical protein
VRVSAATGVAPPPSGPRPGPGGSHGPPP